MGGGLSRAELSLVFSSDCLYERLEDTRARNLTHPQLVEAHPRVDRESGSADSQSYSYVVRSIGVVRKLLQYSYMGFQPLNSPGNGKLRSNPHCQVTV